MDHPKCGIVIIFNHKLFFIYHLKEWNGTNKDYEISRPHSNHLERFTVQVQENYITKQLQIVLQEGIIRKYKIKIK